MTCCLSEPELLRATGAWQQLGQFSSPVTMIDINDHAMIMTGRVFGPESVFLLRRRSCHCVLCLIVNILH